MYKSQCHIHPPLVPCRSVTFLGGQMILSDILGDHEPLPLPGSTHRPLVGPLTVCTLNAASRTVPVIHLSTQEKRALQYLQMQTQESKQPI